MSRKWMLWLVVIALVTSTLACGSSSSSSSSYTPRTTYYGGYTKESCEANWEHLDVDPDLVGWMVQELLNKNQVPNSIGDILQNCIMGGWQGWR